MSTELIYAGRAEDLTPGRMAYLDADGLPIAIANVGGVLYAFSDTCRHEGGSLSSGALIDDTVACPWHGWTYSVRTGKAIVPPVGIRIATYPVRVRDGAIYVEVTWPDA